MNKRTWWKAAAAALVLGGVGIAMADAPKVEQAVWTRASTPPPAPKPPEVVPASASIPAAKPAPLPEQTAATPIVQPNYPLPPKSSSDEVVLPKFRPAAVPPPVVPAATLPPITMPPVPAPTTSEKVAIQPPIPPAREPASGIPAAPVVPPPITKLPDPPPPINKLPIPTAPALPPIPELAPPAQPANSAAPVKPLPPAAPDFNLRPAPGGNSVKTNDVPMLPLPPAASSSLRPKPIDGPMPPTEKHVFPIPEKVPAVPVTLAKPAPPAIPATLPKPEMPEAPAVPARPLPTIAAPELPPVPMILPGVPTAVERQPKNDFTTIPTPGADPMLFRQTTLAAAIGSALALTPSATAFAQGPAKTTDEKLADAQKEIKRLGELLEGRKDADGKASPYDVGAVKEIQKLRDDVFALKNRVQDLETELDKLKKSTTSLKPAQPDPMANKGVVRIENDYPVEITIVVNAMSYRVPANTKLDVTVPVGDFTYQLLNSGTNLAPVRSPIKEKEIVRLRIK